MNWLDGVIIVLIVLGGLIGWRMGLIRSIFFLAGLVLGVIIASNLSEPLAEAITDDPEVEASAAIIAYGVLVLVVFIGVQIVGGLIAKRVRFSVFTMLDSAGGIVFGIGLGLLLGGVLVAAMARFAFAAETDLERAGRILTGSGPRDHLKNALVDAALVPLYLDSRDKLPGRTLGMVPGDYKAALDELERARGD